MKKHTLQRFAHFFNKSVNENGVISGFSADSRTIKEGEIYFALPGNTVDGHHFVDEAFQKGAIAAVVGEHYKKEANKESGGLLIHVKDVLKALQLYAKTYFKENRPKHVIAVTGSLGKTTSKDFISTLLEGPFSVFRSPGNSNSQVGLPLAILNLYKDEEVAVLEMGMTHPGNLLGLIEIAPPDIAVITKVALVHAVNFESISKIAEAKSEIFMHPQTRLGLYDKEIEKVFDIRSSGPCEKESFSLKDHSFDEITQMHHLAPHNLHNLLIGLTVSKALGVDPQQQLNLLKLPERRLQEVTKQGILFINDSYNAAQDSVIAALGAMPKPKQGKKRIGILGSMMELGKFSDDCHRNVGQAALDKLDHLFCYGNECMPMVEVWKSQGRQVELLPSHELIIQKLKEIVKEGDIVLLKGSRSKMMWKVLEGFQ